MSSKFGCIYKHTNTIHDGWSYIGQTIYDINTRWKNGHGYDKCQVFYSAIQKYGWQNFTHEIIEDNIPIEELDERQTYWIQYYHTYIGDPECKGYNMTLGGNVGRGRICSQQTKNKTSNALKGHTVSDYVKRRVSQCSKGRVVSQQTKRKISQASRHIDRTPRSIMCVETSVVYKSINDAVKQLNKSKHWIVNRINNPQHFLNDIHFVEVNEDD